MSGRSSFKYPGGGVRVSYEEERERYELEVTVSILRRRFGDRIVANLLRALAGVNRLSSLAHLSILNSEHVDEGLAMERNFLTIVMLMLGVLRELGRVLLALRQAGIERALLDPAPWHRLDALRRYWDGEHATIMRNSAGFHLGEPDDVGHGLEIVQQRSDRRAFSQIERRNPFRPQLIETRYPLADVTVLAAVDLTDAQARALLDRIPGDSGHMSLDLNAIALDLLRQCGARGI